jgi:hypothetical protein
MSRELVIRQTHAGVPLDALEALSNKGLVRRAQKDLERGEVGSFEMVESGLAVTVSGQRVILVEAGPAKARCVCPSPGVCQHIIAACLKLSQDPAPAPHGSALDDWLAFPHDELLATFGLPVLRAGHELSLAHEAEIDPSATLVVRFPTLNAEVTGLPGAGLAGIIVHGLTPKRHPQLAAAALLTVRRHAGQVWEPPPLEHRHPELMHREDVLPSVTALLEEAVAAGLARLSPGLVERCEALAVASQAAGLHRLGLLLQRIATETTDWLQRRPHADLGQIFGEMATAYALAHSPPNLERGTARESYLETGSLELRGIAAWPWRTPSGYEGLTLLLWDEANRQWNTWSDARPRSFQRGFSAVARYTQAGPWEGADSPAQLARSRFRLLHAKRNRWGRLSSSSRSRALVTGASDVHGLPTTEDWGAMELPPALGLRERDPRAAYHLLRPAAWERSPFDPVAQALRWDLIDRNGHAMEMHLAFDDLARPALEFLEALPAEDLEDAALLGRCVRMDGPTKVQPLALIRRGQAVAIYFTASPAARPDSGTVTEVSDKEVDWIDEAGAEELVATVSGSAVSHLALAAISTVEWLAESGIRARNHRASERLGELAHQASQLSLDPLAKLLQAPASAAGWLRLRWILGVMQRAASS